MARYFDPIVLPRPDSHDVAWAAGFVDGEGCIRTNSGVRYATSEGEKCRYYLRIDVSQKTRPLLEKFQTIFSVGSIHYQKPRPSASEGYKWACSGRAAFYVINMLWPWLGEQKKADFKAALKRVRGSRDDLIRVPQRGQTYVTEGGQ